MIAAISANRSAEILQANPFFAATGPNPVYLGWCVAWVIGVIGLTVLSFQRREL